MKQKVLKRGLSRLLSQSDPIQWQLVWTGMFQLVVTPCEAGELKLKERHLKRTLLCVKRETKQQLLSEVRPIIKSAALRPKCVSRWILGRCRGPDTGRSRPSSGLRLVFWKTPSRSGLTNPLSHAPKPPPTRDECQNSVGWGFDTAMKRVCQDNSNNIPRS